MEIGINSFAALLPDSLTGQIPSAAQRLSELVQEIMLADSVGIDVFGVGEHHRPDYADSSPALILAAAASRTKKIRLTSAVSVLSTQDPVRLFQDFSTLDLLSHGRAEIAVGHGSFSESYALFGFEQENYDALFSEKLSLLKKLREETEISWAGQFRPPLFSQGVYPRPVQKSLPIWIGVGGTPESFVRAGRAGHPLMLAIIGGSFSRFRPLLDLYREAGWRAGHGPDRIKVGIHVTGFIAETTQEAKQAFYPGWLYAFTKIGKERGWGPVTYKQFESFCEPEGSFLIGDPFTVIAKAQIAAQALGGISRISFQMSAASGATELMSRSIELLGKQVAPELRRILS